MLPVCFFFPPFLVSKWIMFFSFLGEAGLAFVLNPIHTAQLRILIPTIIF